MLCKMVADSVSDNFRRLAVSIIVSTSVSPLEENYQQRVLFWLLFTLVCLRSEQFLASPRSANAILVLWFYEATWKSLQSREWPFQHFPRARLWELFPMKYVCSKVSIAHVNHQAVAVQNSTASVVRLWARAIMTHCLYLCRTHLLTRNCYRYRTAFLRDHAVLCPIEPLSQGAEVGRGKATDACLRARVFLTHVFYLSRDRLLFRDGLHNAVRSSLHACFISACGLASRVVNWSIGGSETFHTCRTSPSCPSDDDPRWGGGARQTIAGKLLSPYQVYDNNIRSWIHMDYAYELQCKEVDVNRYLSRNPKYIAVLVPVPKIIGILTRQEIVQLGKMHDVWVPTKYRVQQGGDMFQNHQCDLCAQVFSIFINATPEQTDEKRAKLNADGSNPTRYMKRKAPEKSKASKLYEMRLNKKKIDTLKTHKRQSYSGKSICDFPPRPLGIRSTARIITNYTKRMKPRSFIEEGCAVCGKLSPVSQLSPLDKYEGSLACLIKPGVTRKERFRSSDPIEELEGPILAEGCSNLCVDCEICLNNGVVPQTALVRHNWIGAVPEQLQDLTYAEGIMIARVRHNRCVIRVNSGRVKMSANAIMFSQPVLSVMNKLPPTKDEMSEILAFVFMGSAAPTQEDFDRTPMLVRKKKVIAALEWLKLNHEGYIDLEISKENLDSYKDRDIPVAVDYKRTNDQDTDFIVPGTLAVHETAEAHGTKTGMCSFAVHGLTGPEYASATMKTIKAVALQHLTNKGKMLGIGRSEFPVSMYDNPAAYPGMFPWLFPYGKGGIGHPSHSNKQGDLTRKKSLLLYHDKRFQIDTYFPMIAFNHEQLKAASTGSFLLAKRSKFQAVRRRLACVNPEVAGNIADRLSRGEHVKPNNQAEKLCFDLIKDLDAVAGRVKGSVTSKKYMRNEIWSTVAFFNAPTWFVTLAWDDSKHPLAMYYAQEDTIYKPEIRMSEERYKVMSKNPVGAARFFHYMVTAFLEEVLCWENDKRGIFGHTEAYYATVEQQGRLTLHLHSLIWVKTALSPQEIRDRIMKPDAKFASRLIKYLEDCHRAEYFSGSRDAVISKRKVEPLPANANSDDEFDLNSSYRPPTHTFPKAPPARCHSKACTQFCLKCQRHKEWWEAYHLEVDDLTLRSNVHTHYLSYDQHRAEDAKKKWRLKKLEKREGFKVKRERKGCLSKSGICKARFPRDVHAASEVSADGHINVRHIEPMQNRVNPVLTFLSRCNTDVTSLLSGTAVKAVVSYVSDYVSKLSLKSYQMFASVYDVFEKNSDMTGASASGMENSRHLVRKMVNSMSAKMEIGSPMAAMYLLGNPDCYSSHTYVSFSWKPYVQFVRYTWKPQTLLEEPLDIEDIEDNEDEEERVPISNHEGKFVPTSGVDDYRYRPLNYSHINLYEWIQCSIKKKRSNREKTVFEEEIKLLKNSRPEYYAAAMRRLDEEQIEDDDNLEDDFDLEDEYGIEDAVDVDRTVRDDVSDWETDDEDEVILAKEDEKARSKRAAQYPFLPNHGLFHTHSVTCDFDRLTQIIPNFIGGAVPRSDKGDISAYCMTMLVLFKPWRSPFELKDSLSTWEQAFKEHTFTERQKQLLKNFDVRYECNDARDDHFAQMKKKEADAKKSGKSLFPAGFMGYKDEFADDLNEFDYGSDDDEMHLYENDDRMKGDRTLRILKDALTMKNVMQSAGWLHSPPGEHINLDVDVIMPPARPRIEWIHLIKQQRLELTANKLANLPSITEIQKMRKVRNGASILPADYFNHRSYVSPTVNADIISSIIMSFNLNTEQTRAFKIVVEHASNAQVSPLRMYLGGMGGTGKSQVLHAIIAFFKKRNEDYRYLVLGPTGSTAALLNGSTYHSVFRIPRESKSKNQDDISGIKNEAAALAAVNERLQGVDYVFLDEISMVSCNDFQTLATQAAKARNIHDDSFGSLNMIVAGDFAQLPPMTGPPLYSGSVTLQVSDAMNQRAQNAVLGKILWHQFNTVVILRQNMRQQKQSLEDGKLRTALENMRYGACTPEDIRFLESKIAGFRPEDPKLYASDVRNVSIITAWNSQKDALNQMGAKRFARDTGQTLHRFCSVDRISGRAVDKSKWKHCDQSEIKKISKQLQELLWDQLPSTNSEFIAGSLSLCVGMPIMLRANEATEMCMTKGQESVVCGWNESVGPLGQRVLDVLFVRLLNPPRNITIDGLPENVVPLVRTLTHITVLLPDDTLLSVIRDQVVCLINFGMTDYTSQGKSRAKNPVDLTNCKDHRSYYVALSRGFTADGTIIVQGFSPKSITSGIVSGYLRQELRELEVLDEITRLKFEGKLPPSVNGIYRRRLIRSYYAQKTDLKDPAHFHPAMRWKEGEDERIPSAVIYSDWSPSVTKSLKRKNAVIEPDNLATNNKSVKPAKRARTDLTARLILTSMVQPAGLIWDQLNYSCAYDAMFTVLGNLLIEDRRRWTTCFKRLNPLMDEFGAAMNNVLAGNLSFEQARNQIRRKLRVAAPGDFPMGPNTTSIDLLTKCLFPSRFYAIGSQSCATCGYKDPRPRGILESYLSAGLSNRLDYSKGVPLQDWLSDYLVRGNSHCVVCRLQGLKSRLVVKCTISGAPPLILFDVMHEKLIFNQELMVACTGYDHKMRLRGIIYGGQNHFTCRFIDIDGNMWFHDGITTGQKCLPEVNINAVPDLLELHTCGQKKAVCVIYAQSD